MASKLKSRSWFDVQTAIATTAIVATLGLWNLFATPSKVTVVQATEEPVLPLPTEEPTQSAPTAMSVPTAMSQVKIIFTPGVVPTAVVQQQAQQVQQPIKKKKNKGSNNGSGSVSVTQTKTS